MARVASKESRGPHGVSMDSILFLETIVHCDSYTGQKLFAHGEKNV